MEPLPVPIHTAAHCEWDHGISSFPFDYLRRRDPPASAVAVEREGLLHDARNLVTAVEVYCELLSRPGILDPEYRRLADELSLVGRRTETLIDRALCVGRAEAVSLRADCILGPDRNETPPVGLWTVVERCSGFLRGLANGHSLEVKYGNAATAPIAVPAEAIERILMNLVGNSAAALENGPGQVGNERRGAASPRLQGRAEIRIGVGLPADGVDGCKPCLFERVRLSVEDSGCGMGPHEVERLLNGKTARNGTHGIGFGVVRDLVRASHGEIRVMSAPGRGTCVQIEWPAPSTEAGIREPAFGANSGVQELRRNMETGRGPEVWNGC